MLQSAACNTTKIWRKRKALTLDAKTQENKRRAKIKLYEIDENMEIIIIIGRLSFSRPMFSKQ